MNRRNNRSTYRRGLTRAVITGLTCLLASCLMSSAQQHDPQGDKDKADKVDMIFAQFGPPNSRPHPPFRSPGCAVAVIQSGNIIYSQGYGMADLEQGVEITPKTVFHAASLTKQFTAMAIMLLVNSPDPALHIDLDDRVEKYFTVPVAMQHDMTIRDLLSHISGIRDQWVLLTLAGKLLYHDLITQRDVLNLVSQMTSVDFEPGADILYSNTGFTLASEIVRLKTGKSLSQFAREKMLMLLGMNDTSIIERHDQIPPNHANGYADAPEFKLFMPNLDVTGPTNLYTTVEDLARWDHNFDDTSVGGKTVGGDAALLPMQTPVKLRRGPHHGSKAQLFKDDDGNRVHYGLGLMITTYRNSRVIEHDGRDAGFRSHLIRFPEKNFAVACLCNLKLPEENLPRKMVRAIADIYLFGPAPPSHQPPPSSINPTSGATGSELDKFTGWYHSKEIDATYQVLLQGSSLAIRRDNYKDTALALGSVSAGVFSFKDFGRPTVDVPVGQPITDGDVAFTSDQGTITKFKITGKRAGDYRIHRFPFTKLP